MTRLMGTVLGLFLLLGGAAEADEEPARRRVEFGIHTPQEGVPFDRIVDTWRKAEELGYESAWLYDHFIPIFGSKEKGVLEGWTLLAALARETGNIRIGILVTGNTYRNPALLAKMATTVDHLSDGRLDFGIGAAWEEFEHEAYGFEFHTAKGRAERFAEAMEVIKLLWTEDKPTFDGEFYELHEAPFEPAPLQDPHPPIVIGGKGKKWIMPTVARYADEWNVALGVQPDGVRERIRIMNDVCARVGRDPCVERISAFFPLIAITNIPFAGPAGRALARMTVDDRVADSLLIGSAKAIRERIQEYVDAGATRIIVNLRPPFSHDLMEEFATEVMPHFQ